MELRFVRVTQQHRNQFSLVVLQLHFNLLPLFSAHNTVLRQAAPSRKAFVDMSAVLHCLHATALVFNRTNILQPELITHSRNKNHNASRYMSNDAS